MSRLQNILVALLITGCGFCQATAEDYAIDGSHTAVVFAINHFGYSFTYGRFNKVEGSFVMDSANPAANSFSVTIDANSIDSNDKKRDEHLRGADFFNVRQFPVITFESTQVVPSGDGFQLTGDMTMHGVTKSITIPLQLLGSGKGPMGKQRAGFLANFKVNRSEFGMNNMVGPIGDEVTVMMSFEGTVE